MEPADLEWEVSQRSAPDPRKEGRYFRPLGSSRGLPRAAQPRPPLLTGINRTRSPKDGRRADGPLVGDLLEIWFIAWGRPKAAMARLTVA